MQHNVFGKLISRPRMGVALLVLGLCVAMACVIVIRTPPFMDEFCGYHTLACSQYPMASWNTFREPCTGVYDLMFLGRWLKLRSFPYIGASPALLYLPLFKVVPHYLSARLLWLFFLPVLVAAGASLSGAGWLVSFAVIGASFPLMFLLAVNLGPVAISLVASFLVPWLFVRGAGSSRMSARVLLAATASLMLLLATDEKPFFLLALPSILLTTCAIAAPRDRREWARLAKAVVPALVVYGVLTAWLLGLSTRDGRTYLDELLRHHQSLEKTPLTGVWHALVPFQFLLNFSNFSHRIHGLSLASHQIIMTLCWWGLCLWIIVETWEIRKRQTAILLGAGLLTTLMLMLDRNVWAAHHVVIVLPPVLLAVAGGLARLPKRREALIVACALALLQASIAFSAVLRPPEEHAAWSRLELFDRLRSERIGREYVIAHASWGTYYISSLYGHREQLAVYLDAGNDDDRIPELKRVLGATHRKLALVRYIDPENPVEPAIAKAFPGLKLDYPKTASGWTLWLEP